MNIVGMVIALVSIILFIVLMIPELRLERIRTQEQIEFYRLGAEYFNRLLKIMDE